MPSIPLLPNIEKDFPSFHLKPDNEFRWSPDEMTIYYDSQSKDTAALLHELSHAILKHTTYLKDVGLLEIERDAWTHAQTILAPRYGLTIDDETIQDSLDTYRDWLHARSMCPDCKATGFQVKQHEYKCIVCGTSWHVNDARSCALRRYTKK
jgi:hypothetical protein